jgi:NADPH2:quinone reductase
MPAIGAGDVLIRVEASGVNRPDLMQRLGKYPPPPGAPDVPGMEVAGVVAAVGSAVDRWRAGDRVMALVAGGGLRGVLRGAGAPVPAHSARPLR